MEKKLDRGAKKLGLGKARTGAYVFGTMRRLGLLKSSKGK